MRTLLTSTALVALFSMGAIAQEATGTAGPSDLLTQGYQLVDTDGLASKLLGFPVYTSAASDADRIGEINDLVIGDDGQVAAVILGVGGFLGVGEKNVAVNYDELQWTVAEDDTERLVLGVSREVLETAAAVELIDDEPAAMAAAPAADQPMVHVDETATGTIPAAPAAADPNAAPMDLINRDALVDFDETTLTAEQLIGIQVYGPSDEHIGAIGDFALSSESGTTIDAVIIDFGGFLGIGVKEVAVAYEDLQFFADPNGNNPLLVLNVTREQMEQAPAFDRETYAAQRDTQRIVVSPAVASAG